MSPILQSLSLVAYRGVSGLTLDDLSSINLVVGANNAGKSSILEAAGLLLRPPDPGQWVSAVRHRDLDMALVDGVWSLFPSGEALHLEDGPQPSNTLVLEGTITGTPRRIEARATASQVLGATEAMDLSVRVEVSVDGDPPLTLRFPAAMAVLHEVATWRVFSVMPSTHASTKALVEHLSRVVDDGQKGLAVELLRVFDPAVEDLDVVTSGGLGAVRVTHATRGVVDLSSFGDGMRRAATLALALARATQGVLLVDEIEAGIHPTVLRPVLSKLLEAASRASVQIIATTHSLEAIDAIIDCTGEVGMSDQLAAYWVQRSDGQHGARRYDHAKLGRLREGGLDIR